MASRTMVSKLQLLVPFMVVFLLVSSMQVKAQLTCQTSGGSPLAVDANNCVNYLIGKGNTECCQNNCAGPDACTNMYFDGTAATDICGNCGQCVPCQQAGNYLANIIENCESGGLVGGYIYGFTNPTVNVNVYHT
ncbi:unnamed protein product [Calypogeia fissa]